MNENRWVALAAALARTIAGIAMVVFSILIVPVALVVFGAIGYGVYQSIYRLGMVHFAPVLAGAARNAFELSVPIVAAATVGMPYALGIVLFLFHKRLSNTAKGWASFFLVIGIIELVLMYFYEQALTLNVTFIPDALVSLGALIYTGIGGLNLVPAFVVPIVAHGAATDKHPTISAAVADCFKFMLEAVLFVAGVAAEFYFGIALGLPALYVGVASFLVGFGFLWTGFKFVDSHKRHDHFDMREWSRMRMVFGGYLAIVGALSVAQLATGHQDAVPTLLKDIGIRLNFFVQALLVTILIYTEARTARIDDVNGDGKDDRTGQLIGIRLPARATAVMAALRGQAPAQLPKPGQSPTVVMAQEKPKVSETTGQRYDETGVVVMDDGEQLRQRAKAERERLLSEPASILGGDGNPKA